MTKRSACLLFCACLGTAAIFSDIAVAADTLTITATPRLTWKSPQGESTTQGVPITVELKKGDVLAVDIPDGPIPHGFVTIDKKGTEHPSPAKDFVQACGETKPDAVLREIACVDPPKPMFGNPDGFTGTLKLEVTDKFKDDTNFWCVFHKAKMWGVVRLKPEKAAYLP